MAVAATVAVMVVMIRDAENEKTVRIEWYCCERNQIKMRCGVLLLIDSDEAKIRNRRYNFQGQSSRLKYFIAHPTQKSLTGFVE